MRLTMLAMTDEYTALQKYISTYKDPRAALFEKDDDAEPNTKKWWQVRTLPPRPSCASY